MERTEAGRFTVSKLRDTSSAGHAHSAAGTCTHLRPGNPKYSNVSVTHFIDDSDDSDIFVNHLPDLFS